MERDRIIPSIYQEWSPDTDETDISKHRGVYMYLEPKKEVIESDEHEEYLKQLNEYLERR